MARSNSRLRAGRAEWPAHRSAVQAALPIARPSGANGAARPAA